jgi:hypothetical protein
MFDRIEFGDQLPGSSKKPSEEERQEILLILNQGNFSERLNPGINILAKLNEAYDYSEELNNGNIICHTVARYLQESFPGNLFLQSGYLLQTNENGEFIPQSRINLADLLNLRSIKNEPSVLLETHSVVKDIDGNYFECLVNDYGIATG